MSVDVKNSRIIQFFYGFIAIFVAVYLFRGELNLWHTSGITLMPFIYWRRILLGAILLFITICAINRSLPGKLPLGFSLAGLALVFFSDWLDNQYSLLRGPSIRGEILLGSFLAYGVLSKSRTSWISFFALASMLGLFFVFIFASQGELIYSDDHPVFLQRLILLKENFPFIPFYNPLWNAGIDQRDFFATGALNIFFLLAPLIYLLDISQYYTHLVGILLFIIVPTVVGLAAYMHQRSTLQSAIAAIIAVTNSLLWYRWALKYGTLGFICASSLIPLVMILGIQILDKETNWGWKRTLLCVASTTLMLLWSPTGLVFIPLALLAVTRIKNLITHKTRLATVLSLMIINIPWILLFVSVSRVSSYVSQETMAKRRVAYEVSATAPGTATATEVATSSVASILEIIRDWASPENPIILFFALPAIFLLKKPYRVGVGFTCAWAVLLGTIGTIKLPQLELDRMLLIAGLISVIPISAVIEQLINKFNQSTVLTRTLTTLTAGFIFASPFSVGSILLNRTVEHYQIAQPVVKNLATAIAQHGGAGRTLFAGFILHELSGGHIAPLVFWSNKELIASSHVHDKWHYIDVIPSTFLKDGDQGIEEYMNLMNISAVVAHERKWVQYFQQRPQLYTEKWGQDRFHLFERKNQQTSFFVSGSGKILSRTSRSVEITVETPEAVLKYNYYPFLRSSACTLSAEPAHDVINLIKLSNCPLNTPITIDAINPFQRLILGEK